MKKRVLGRTALSVSALGFGCGAVGGLMIRGTAHDRERAVARAVDLGINYFDTSAAYGDGTSETNLGRALSLVRTDVLVASKTRVDPTQRGRIAGAIARSADASLQRLGRDAVDVFLLHSPVSLGGDNGMLDWRSVVEEVVPAFERLRQQGKIRFYGFSGTGDAAALPNLLDTGAFDVAQVIYNLLNPSAGGPARFSAVGQDFGNVLARAKRVALGVVGIRVLAAGALSDRVERHPLALPTVEPMGSSADYNGDVERARRLLPLVREGHVGSLAEAALRFAIGPSAISTALVGFSDLAQIEQAAAAIGKGPLPAAALDRIGELLAP